MHRAKAYKKVQRKIARAKPCPFCGVVPEFDCRVAARQHQAGKQSCFFATTGSLLTTGYGKAWLIGLSIIGIRGSNPAPHIR